MYSWILITNFVSNSRNTKILKLKKVNGEGKGEKYVEFHPNHEDKIETK